MLVFGKVGITLTVGTKSLNINLLDNHRRGTLETLPLTEQVPVLCDISGPRIDHIGGTLSHARRGIDIAAMDACRLLGNHLASESILTHNAVAA